MKRVIRLSAPHMGGEELKYINEAFQTNWIAPAGDNITYFEKSLEDYLSQNVKVAALSSGTAAIHLALILAGVEKGDEVLCQSLTFAGTAFPILYQGALPIFIDSEKDTWNMSPYYLEKAIKDRLKKGKRPKAIIVVHIFGMPAKMDELASISKKFHIPIIEDAAEALGSEYKGMKCGTIADYGILSFNGNKIITTSGGGALITKKYSLKEKAIFLATQSKDETLYFQHSNVGYNYRLSNISAGIGRGQMEVLSSHVDKRRENNKFYRELFKPYDFINVFSEYISNIKSNHWLTCISLSENKGKKTVSGLLNCLNNNQIESRFIWKPMHLQPVFKEAVYYGEDLAESLFNSSLCLPSGSNLNQENKERIIEVVLNYLDA
ncbi:DegT/DnrJ/EryC1/StrS family aminotransferase [Hyunsoonleella aestuarii]|uniref:DegT/DnrJ/EryC1/StrS family aminotransferase n=1 Tax=Hyunsoonleella aestuarii TaxID=912802 RepID=A0ABP8E931_9FLAO|nr:DegT/DnrJ/EryC1/StrS family aminotransferase [Hyunsoonleella aestuarii]